MDTQRCRDSEGVRPKSSVALPSQQLRLQPFSNASNFESMNPTRGAGINSGEARQQKQKRVACKECRQAKVGARYDDSPAPA